MPWGDGTGPIGLGPMTGRRAGYCAGFGVAGYMNPSAGRGFWGLGRGRLGGRGRRNWFYATGLTGWQRAAMGWASPWAWQYPLPYAAPMMPPISREQELDALKSHAEYFEQALEGIRRRIESLEAQRDKTESGT